ncbi:MAG: hypothetical protein A3E83_04925 [Gammaproteobacteria bacterium RIFCSPHIGHO2_12_FULL_41_20]|nr:MAG: hypothetical protein A3E83_04925 [Gammaproteobacteria bacterium RIFCSPHIGHO2_12_FULL_41_20]
MIDRDDKYEGQEDSEYHFSDDEANYEVEEEKKPAVTASPKVSLLSHLPNLRRMAVGGIIFVILVLVIYRMLTSTSTTPSTNIVPSDTSSLVAAAKPTAPASVAQQPHVISAVPAVPQQAQATVTPTSPPTVSTVATALIPQSAPAATPPQAAQMASATPAMPPAVSSQSLPTQAQPGATTMLPSVAAIQGETAAPGSQMAALQAENMRLVTQLQVEASQKLAEFSVQNRVLREQVQVLTARVTEMESQLSQLVNQTLGKPGPSAVTPNNASPVAGPLPRIPFSVQAIIPGRAWLKSDNGETVTVAEGDMLKGYGRVTKIDPYDGIVEVNVGNRSVTLSYGNGGG